MGAIRRLVADKEHVFFLTGDIGDHSVEPCSLLDVPDDLRVGLTTLELRATSSPELREVELEVPSFVPEVRKQLAIEDERSDFGSSPSDIKDAVGHFFGC